MDPEIKELKLVLRVQDAQTDTISLIQMLFDTIKEEVYVVTSAKLDHRVNIWRVP